MMAKIDLKITHLTLYSLPSEGVSSCLCGAHELFLAPICEQYGANKLTYADLAQIYL